MSRQRRTDASLIKLKLKQFGMRSAILKAIEETNELLAELEQLLASWDKGDHDRIARVVANIAEEYADVSVSVFDTFKRVWIDNFAQIVEKKRRLVYDTRLPHILLEDETA